MSKKMRKPSAPTRHSYAPPSLTIYGGMAKLTAAGTGAATENMVNPMGTASMA